MCHSSFCLIAREGNQSNFNERRYRYVYWCSCIGICKIQWPSGLYGAAWAVPTAAYLLVIQYSSSPLIASTLKSDQNQISKKKYYLLHSGIVMASAAAVIAIYSSVFALGCRLSFGKLSAESLRTIGSYVAPHILDCFVFIGWDGFVISSSSYIVVGHNEIYPHARALSQEKLQVGILFSYFGLRALRGLAEAISPGCTFSLLKRVWSR